MWQGLHARFAYEDGYRKAVKVMSGRFMFAEACTETDTLIFKYDTGKMDLIIKEKFTENKDLWKRFLALQPADIIETVVHAMNTASKPQETPTTLPS